MKAFGPFRLDPVNQCLWRGETRITLTPKVFAVLRHLIDHPGRLVTQEELLEAIWPETYVQPEILRKYILELRKALGDDPKAPRFIETPAEARLPVCGGSPGRIVYVVRRRPGGSG